MPNESAGQTHDVNLNVAYVSVWFIYMRQLCSYFRSFIYIYCYLFPPKRHKRLQSSAFWTTYQLGTQHTIFSNRISTKTLQSVPLPTPDLLNFRSTITVIISMVLRLASRILDYYLFEWLNVVCKIFEILILKLWNGFTLVDCTCM